MNVVGFASGSPLSQVVMTRIAREHRLRGIVVPQPRSGMVAAARAKMRWFRSPLARLGAPLLRPDEVEHVKPHAIVVASYPDAIPASIISAATRGAFNVHMSLLPRHRGVDPIFWTYWHGDHLAGVTTHWISAQLDAGDIAAQVALPLERGRPSRSLYGELASLAQAQVAHVLTQLAEGQVQRVPQSFAEATYGSSADIARARIPFASWPAEKVWHVLSGLGDQRHGLLEDHGHRVLAHGRAGAYRHVRGIEPGQVREVAGGYELHCQDGIVLVARQG